jgi:hypothetical protein
MNHESMTMLVNAWRSSAERYGYCFTHLLLGADVVKGLGTAEDAGRLLSATFTEQVGHPVTVEIVTDRSHFPATNAIWGNESWTEKMRRHEALSS